MPLPRLTQRRERAARLVDLADTLEASAEEHDVDTARMLRRMSDQLAAVAILLVPEDYPSADYGWDQLTL